MAYTDLYRLSREGFLKHLCVILVTTLQTAKFWLPVDHMLEVLRTTTQPRLPGSYAWGMSPRHFRPPTC